MPDGTPGGLLFIGEAPGFEEVKTGHGFEGQAGKNLFKALEEIGYTEIPFARANAVLCHPTKNGKNRKPTKDEITACRDNLDAAIAHYRPKVIVAIGKTAAEALDVKTKVQYFKKMEFMDFLFFLVESFDLSFAHTANSVCRNKRFHGLNPWPFIIPIPHTSGLSWNRSTNGLKHSDLGKKLLKIAVELAK